MRDKTKIKGYIESRSDDGFVLIDNAGLKREIKYSDVRKVKKKGLHPAAWVAVGTAAGLGVFGGALLIALKNN